MKKSWLLSLILVMLLAGCQTRAADNPPVSPPATATFFVPPTATPGPTMTPEPTATSAALARPPAAFDGQRAYADVEAQMAFGPRVAGSQAHVQQVDWMKQAFSDAGWAVEVQATTFGGQPVQNVVAKRGEGRPWIIIGAHYDSRMAADRDPDPALRAQPVPAANDGASGVAILTELARSLPADLNKTVWLLAIDTEDNGDLPGYSWIMGSTAFAESLTDKPDAVVIVDMIGDADLNIYYERSSDTKLKQAIWAQANALGYRQFIAEERYNMIDDHTPFLQQGIPAVDIIDFDYPYWHTTQDTLDKVSADSLLAVGDTLWHWLVGG